jgi:coproporphyrinogen III oxidase-like Fe-S oxidoreductase
MLLAENAVLSAHGFICEDGTEFPKEKGQEAAQEGGETLEGMYAQGCESLEQARIRMAPGVAGTEEDEEMR